MNSLKLFLFDILASGNKKLLGTRVIGLDESSPYTEFILTHPGSSSLGTTPLERGILEAL